MSNMLWVLLPDGVLYPELQPGLGTLQPGHRRSATPRRVVSGPVLVLSHRGVVHWGRTGEEKKEEEEEEERGTLTGTDLVFMDVSRPGGTGRVCRHDGCLLTPRRNMRRCHASSPACVGMKALGAERRHGGRRGEGHAAAARRGCSLRRPLSSRGRETMAARPKAGELRERGKPDPAPPLKTPADLPAREEHYRLLNAELEAKTADLVRQAEQVMREQNEVRSGPVFTALQIDAEDEEDGSRTTKPRESPLQRNGVKVMTKKLVSRPTTQNTHPANRRKEQDDVFNTGTLVPLHDDNTTSVEDLVKSAMTKTVQALKKLDNTDDPEDVEEDSSDTGDTICTEAQIRVLKAKVRIMQEELEQQTYETSQKDVENSQLMKKVREIEEDRARLQKTTNIQQTQIDKHRALAEESSRKCEALQLQVAALQKEIASLNRAQKQAAGNQSSVEVRLNRALEEVERLKTQLSQMKQVNKEKSKEEHLSKENMLSENRMLQKQKAELIVGFKKQLKLIDILKRQKMHFEAAKLLSFTEEEFMKALDWGKS